MILTSAQSQAPGSKEALDELCKLYWYPLYAFIRSRGYSEHDAKDLTQGFFLDLLNHKAFTRVDRRKGKFRSFLLASLQKHLSNERKRARCLKRGGEVEFAYLDIERAEDRYRLEPVEAVTPEKIFDARFAMALLGEARSRLRSEYAAEGKERWFETLKGFLDPGNTKELPSYEDVANQLQVTVANVKTLIHRLRKRYQALLREEVLRTVSDPKDVEAEINHLCEAVIVSEGRLVP